jgi:hypothetical protein
MALWGILCMLDISMWSSGQYALFERESQWILFTDIISQGELTITEEMEALEACLFLDQVPPNWTKRAYPSLMTLGPWFADLTLRLKELEAWSLDFNVSCADMHHLTVGIPSEKCVIRRFHHAKLYLHKPRFAPNRSRRIFLAGKIHSMPSFRGEVIQSVPCPSFGAC